MRIIPVLLAVLLSSSAAVGQTTLKQSGPVTGGHVPSYVQGIGGNSAVVQDGGPALAGLIKEIGVTNTGTPICINDASVSGPYHQFCLGANSLGGGLISFNAYGGATPIPLHFNVNGLDVDFSSLLVTSPVSPSDVIWNPNLHQNIGGGNDCGHRLQWVDQLGLICGDHHSLNTSDASLLVILTATGTPTPTEVIGFLGIVGSVTFTVHYTIQAGDTSYAIVLNNLLTCIKTYSNTGCSITPSSGSLNLGQALAAFRTPGGYTPDVGYNVIGGVNGTPSIVFDWPWGNNNSAGVFGGNTITPINSANTTLTLGPVTLDGGPYYSTARLVPGRTPVLGDRHGILYFTNQSAANSGIDVQGASISTNLAQVGTSGYDNMLFSTGQIPRMTIGQGVYYSPFDDPGPGVSLFATYETKGPTSGYLMFDRTGGSHNSIWYRDSNTVHLNDDVNGSWAMFSAGVVQFPELVNSTGGAAAFVTQDRSSPTHNTTISMTGGVTTISNDTTGNLISWIAGGVSVFPHDVVMNGLVAGATGRALCFDPATHQLKVSAGAGC